MKRAIKNLAMQLIPWLRDWRRAAAPQDYLEMNLILSDGTYFPIVLVPVSPHWEEEGTLCVPVLGGRVWAHVQKQIRDGKWSNGGEFQLEDLQVMRRMCGWRTYYGVFILRHGLRVVAADRPHESIVIGIGSNGQPYEPIHS